MPRKSARGPEGDEGQQYGHRFTADASFVGCCFDVISAAIPCTVIDLGSGRGTSVFDTSDPHGFNRSDPFTAALCQKKGEIVVTRQPSQDRHAVSDFSVFARHILGHGIQ